MLKKILFSTGLLSCFTMAASAQCAASFTVSVNGQTVTFTNTSTGTNNNTLYAWSFGDQGYGYNQNEVHTYQYGGTYIACLTIYDSMQSCYSSFCDSFYVNGPQQPCNASFGYTQQGSNVYFSDLSTGGPFVGWYWDFGDGNFSTLQNPVHAYQQPGPFYVCITAYSASDTCTFCDSVYTCDVSASFTMNTASDPTIVFNNTSTGGNAPYYYWNFGDGNYGYGFNASHTYQYAGTYLVCLTVGDTLVPGCSSTYCDSVTIVNAGNQPCDSSWVFYPDTSNNGYGYFFATGNNIVSWYWTFGDNTTGTGPQQYHQYPQSGTYYVCLTVVTQNGDSCTSCDSVSVLRIGSGIGEDHSPLIPLVSYPNPFTESTTISYTLSENASVELDLFDMIGNKIATLEKGDKQRGKYELNWNASDLAAGSYFIRINVNGRFSASRLTLIR